MTAAGAPNAIVLAAHTLSSASTAGCVNPPTSPWLGPTSAVLLGDATMDMVGPTFVMEIIAVLLTTSSHTRSETTSGSRCPTWEIFNYRMQPTKEALQVR